MFDKIRKMRDFQKHAQEIKKELEETLVDVQDVPGIRAVISGTQDFRRIDIDPGRLSPDQKTSLEKDLLATLQAAVKKSQTLATQRMASMIPPQFNP